MAYVLSTPGYCPGANFMLWRLQAQALFKWTIAGNRIVAFVSGQVLAESQQDLANISLMSLKQHTCDMELLGFAVMSAPLRADSASVIAELKTRARVRTMMVTGDHLQATLPVAHALGILKVDDKLVILESDEQTQQAGHRYSDEGCSVVDTAHSSPRPIDHLVALTMIAESAVCAVTGPYIDTAVQHAEPAVLKMVLQSLAVAAHMKAEQKARLVKLVGSQGLTLASKDHIQEVTAGHRITLVYSLHGSNAHKIVKDFHKREGVFDVAYGPGWERRGRHTTKHDVQFLPNAWQSVKKQTHEGHQRYKLARSVLRMLACWAGSQ
ncbi:hypothetical protein ABBQ38_006402 [Trebouxia sp. C0009 RCD-2024]